MEDPLDGFDLFDPLQDQFDSDVNAMGRIDHALTLLRIISGPKDIQRMISSSCFASPLRTGNTKNLGDDGPSMSFAEWPQRLIRLRGGVGAGIAKPRNPKHRDGAKFPHDHLNCKLPGSTCFIRSHSATGQRSCWPLPCSTVSRA